MKVCLISFEYPPNSLTKGGAGTYASFLVKGLENRGIDTYTITTGDNITHDQKIYRIPIPNVTYWRRLFFVNSAIDLLHDLNRIHKFNLVHFNEPHIITKSPNLPTVCTFHSTQLNELKLNLTGSSLKTMESVRDLVVKNPVGHLCDIITGYMSNRIICPSSDLVNPLKYCFVDERKIHVIPNGIDPKVFDEMDSDTDFLDKYAIENEPFVLYIGSLYSLKGVHYLIKAFQSIKKEHTNLKLVIAGSGDFEPYLRKIALGTRDILFIGYIDSLMIKKLLYENCLTVVVPSIYETFPMVVLEAMACSKPVIASNVGGIRSMIKHGKNGFLVKPKDVRGLEIFINKLYENPDLGRKMGTLGRKLVEKEFTIDKMVDRTLKVYDSLLQLS
jgi:glycosyltransferase involved in cell wall biosynthesis